MGAHCPVGMLEIIFSEEKVNVELLKFLRKRKRKKTKFCQVPMSETLSCLTQVAIYAIPDVGYWSSIMNNRTPFTFRSGLV